MKENIGGWRVRRGVPSEIIAETRACPSCRCGGRCWCPDSESSRIANVEICRVVAAAPLLAESCREGGPPTL